MRLRREEIKTMRELIAAEYKDEDEYIHVLFNGVVDMLSKRDSYGVGMKMFGRVIPYGPFYDVRIARKLGGGFAANMGGDVVAFTTNLNAPYHLELKNV
jgi:hypothetical protein